MAKSKRRSKQAKRRSEKRAGKQREETVSAADRLLGRIQREARERREESLRRLQLEEERAWRREQLRRARGLDDWDEEK